MQRIMAGAMALGLASMLSAAPQTGGSPESNSPSQTSKKKQGRKHGGKRHKKTSTNRNAPPLNPAN